MVVPRRHLARSMATLTHEELVEMAELTQLAERVL